MSRARAILAAIGPDVAIGYGVFAVIGLFVHLLSTSGLIQVTVTLADLLSGDLAEVVLDGGSWKGVLLVLLATATVGVPVAWNHRFAPLVYAVPLAITLVAFWPLYVQHRRQQEALRAMGDLGQALGDVAAQMSAQIASPLANLGIAAWMLFATVIYLALKGIARVLKRR